MPVADADYTSFPTLFYKPSTTLVGPSTPITIPLAAQPVEEHVPDYEVELTVVIGKNAKNVSEADALDYVLGYTVGNDVCIMRSLPNYLSVLQISFRKHQMAVSQWGFSKGFDDATPFGPCIVSSREIHDPHNLQLTTNLNGYTMQDGTTS
jgi:2-keto-4-pentenoate hydratase/2-oxohepta-3-ene-1,7-dioic acid hydratase in catechol pathway